MTEIEYAVEEYDEDGRFYLQYEVYSSLKEAKKALENAKAENADALGHSFGILKIVYENGLEVETERME